MKCSNCGSDVCFEESEGVGCGPHAAQFARNEENPVHFFDSKVHKEGEFEVITRHEAHQRAGKDRHGNISQAFADSSTEIAQLKRQLKNQEAMIKKLLAAANMKEDTVVAGTEAAKNAPTPHVPMVSSENQASL